MQLIKDNMQNKTEAGFKVQARSPLAKEGENRPALLIYDVIDPWWGVSAEAVKREMLNITASDVDVYINSPGGDVFEATAIYTTLIAHPAKIHVHIDGWAASAATRIAMAGDTIEMAESGFYMIHNAWTLGMGNANDFRKTADMLDKVDTTIVNDYTKKTGQDEQQIRDWMDAETWFTAAEALENGFIDQIIQAGKSTSNQANNQLKNKQWNLSAYKNAPTSQQTDPSPHREHLARYANMLQQIG
jgi:ATP-dependent Clp protease, protease subunit